MGRQRTKSSARIFSRKLARARENSRIEERTRQMLVRSSRSPRRDRWKKTPHRQDPKAACCKLKTYHDKAALLLSGPTILALILELLELLELPTSIWRVHLNFCLSILSALIRDSKVEGIRPERVQGFVADAHDLLTRSARIAINEVFDHQ